jgi:integrase
MPKAKRRQPVKGKPGIYWSENAAGKKRHEFTYRDSDGKQRWETVEGGIRAAERAKADKLARMGKGEKVRPMPKLTFSVAAAAYLKSEEAKLRPATVQLYRSAIKNHLNPAWKDRKLDTIDVDAVALVIEDMQKAGKKAWTIRSVLTVASRVFDYAARRKRWAGRNPVKQLDRNERPRSDQRDRRILTRDELGKLIEAAPDGFDLLIALSAGTGMRLGECLGLTWRFVDFDAGTVTIRYQLDREGNLADPKTEKSKRTIELPSPVLSGLRQWKLRSPNSGPADLVFHGDAGESGEAIDRRTLRRELTAAIKASGIDTETERAPSFHDFRHSFASAFISAGGDLVELSSHLGHSSPAITASTYSHDFERAARSDERRKRIEGMFGSALETSVETEDGSSPHQPADTEASKPASVHQIADRRSSAQ